MGSLQGIQLRRDAWHGKKEPVSPVLQEYTEPKHARKTTYEPSGCARSQFTAGTHTGNKPFYPVGHAVIPSEPTFLSHGSRSERVFLSYGSRSQPIYLSHGSRSDPPCLLKIAQWAVFFFLIWTSTANGDVECSTICLRGRIEIIIYFTKSCIDCGMVWTF